MPATPERPPYPVTLIAFDYGRRRIGAAVGQEVTASASAVGTARNSGDGPDWKTIDAWIREWQPQLLVVGLPYSADGSASDLLDAARGFARQLERYALPVEGIDERYSSLEAQDRLREARAAGGRGRITREAIDQAAAVAIAERWLAAHARERN